MRSPRAVSEVPIRHRAQTKKVMVNLGIISANRCWISCLSRGGGKWPLRPVLCWNDLLYAPSRYTMNATRAMVWCWWTVVPNPYPRPSRTRGLHPEAPPREVQKTANSKQQDVNRGTGLSNWWAPKTLACLLRNATEQYQWRFLAQARVSLNSVRSLQLRKPSW